MIEVANGQIVRDAMAMPKAAYVTLCRRADGQYVAAAPMAQGDNPFRRLIGLQDPFPGRETAHPLQDARQLSEAFHASIDKWVASRAVSAGRAS